MLCIALWFTGLWSVSVHLAVLYSSYFCRRQVKGLMSHLFLDFAFTSVVLYSLSWPRRLHGFSCLTACDIIRSFFEAVLYSFSHLCRRLLEDSGCRASSVKRRSWSSATRRNEQWTGGWNADDGRSGWTDRAGRGQRSTRWEENGDGRVERSSRGWRSERVEEQTAVSCGAECRENDDLYHRLLHFVLDADVFILPTVDLWGRAY